MAYHANVSGVGSQNGSISGPAPSVTTALSSPSASILWQTTGSEPTIPGRIDADLCSESCYAYCPASNSACLDAATSVVRTCSPQWDAYASAGAVWSAQNVRKSGSTAVVIVQSDDLISSYYTSSSIATDYIITDHYGSTYNPVYVFGSASLSTYTQLESVTVTKAASYQVETTVKTFNGNGSEVTTTEQILGTIKGFPAPTPFCSIVGVSAQDCGQCTIGTVSPPHSINQTFGLTVF